MNSPFHFVANARWLDFVNTEPVEHGRPVDQLATFADLVAWARAAGALDAAGADDALGRWGGAGAGAAEGEAALALGRELRAALGAVAGALAAGEPVPDDAVAAINRVLVTRPGYPRLAREGADAAGAGAFVLRVEPVGAAAAHLLVPVAESAAEFLASGGPRLVRKCEGPGCVLYFVDTTKNKGRRWCSMDACGGRHKAAAYYRRSRARNA